MNNKKIKLIDCTLRDGGYYNNWNFNKKLATAYLHTMQTINVDCIEIGFVFLDNKKKLGLFSKINNNILNNLKLKNKNKLAVMINASDLLNKLNKVEFNKFLKEKLKVGYIRIACHKDELKKINIRLLLI